MSDVAGYRRPHFNTQPDRLYPPHRLRATFSIGLTRDQIKEVIMQAAIYCGVPAPNSAFHQAKEVFAQMEPGAA